MTKQYCIIGSGVAGVNAAKAIRDHDKEAQILILGSEESLPYNRIKLSKDLFSDLSSEKVLIKKEKWYQAQNIQTLAGTKVDLLDTDNHSIITSTGETIRYDKLLICTGAKNRKLTINGIDKKGIFTIREMHEAEDFKAFIKNKSSVVNIGRGIQGLETVWSMFKAGKKVSVVEAASRLMARQLDEKASQILKNKMEEAGIDVYLNASIDRIIGEDEVTGIVVSGQTLPCDSVTYSIGVVPNLDLVENTPIHTNRGIVVNERMETSVEDVYAAGDVTELNGEVEGLWGRAMDQGKVAGANMASAAEWYQKTTPTALFDAFNLALFSIGIVDEKQCDTTIMEEDGNDKYTRLFIKEHKIVGVISLEGIMASISYKSAIENQVSLVGINLNNISVTQLMNEIKEKFI